MIQVDFFWSFAIGCFFAICARRQLSQVSSLVNEYFVFTLIYLSCIFSPSGTYLLHRFPGWETMFYHDRYIHPVLPAVFTLTNTLCGIIGFQVSAYAFKNRDPISPVKYCAHAYMAMMSILGLGYDRFLYAGSINEWNLQKDYSYADFFQSEVFYTLLVMAPFIFLPMIYAISEWTTQNYPSTRVDSTYHFNEKGKETLVRTFMETLFSDFAIIVTVVYVTRNILGLDLLPASRFATTSTRIIALTVSSISLAGIFRLLVTFIRH